MPIRAQWGELWGSLSILAFSAIVPLVLGLRSREGFDYARLQHVEDAAVARPGAPASSLSTSTAA